MINTKIIVKIIKYFIFIISKNMYSNVKKKKLVPKEETVSFSFWVIISIFFLKFSFFDIFIILSIATINEFNVNM